MLLAVQWALDIRRPKFRTGNALDPLYQTVSAGIGHRTTAAHYALCLEKKSQHSVHSCQVLLNGSLYIVIVAPKPDDPRSYHSSCKSCVSLFSYAQFFSFSSFCCCCCCCCCCCVCVFCFVLFVCLFVFDRLKKQTRSIMVN